MKWLHTNDIVDHKTYRQEQSKYKNVVDSNKNETWESKDVETHIGETRSTEA